jgi:uncharacterized protein (DUF2235 family)
MGRRLVVLFDGTSNEVKEDLTNVLKLYRVITRSADQLVFYQPGIGTVPLVTDWSPLTQKAVAVFGLASGWGLDARILAGYCFLIENYREGDQVFLFGFSRGSYTARALAALISQVGLLTPEQQNLAPYLLKAYKLVKDGGFADVARFGQVFRPRYVPIDFMGLWDSVASVFRRASAFSLPTQVILPYTVHNPCVRVYREAASIDERRRLFRLLNWHPDAQFKPGPFAEPDGAQDAQTVWFAGIHSDIGGGFAEAESQAAKFPLIWLTREAQRCGLAIDEAMFGHVAEGKPLAGGQHAYVAPDLTTPIHDSMTWFWKLLEYLPKNRKWKRFPEATDVPGYYLPRGEPRKIAEGAALHRSVVDRMAATAYKPVNLPQQYTIADTLPPPSS